MHGPPESTAGVTGRTDASLLAGTSRATTTPRPPSTSVTRRASGRWPAAAARPTTPAASTRTTSFNPSFARFFDGARRRVYEVPPDGELWGLLMVLALNKVRTLVGFHQAGKRAVRNTAFLPDMDAHPALAADDSAAAFLKLVMDEQMAALPESNRDNHPTAHRGLRGRGDRPRDRPVAPHRRTRPPGLPRAAVARLTLTPPEPP